MDKLVYHYNKKKLPGKTPGTYLYYYPCKRRGQANARLEDKSYIVLEVSSRQWEMLIELDRLEYNSNHAYSRHTVRMPDSDENALSPTLRDKGIAATRQLAKRQLTWLRAMPERIVIDCLTPDAPAQIMAHIRDKIGKPIIPEKP